MKHSGLLLERARSAPAALLLALTGACAGPATTTPPAPPLATGGQASFHEQLAAENAALAAVPVPTPDPAPEKGAEPAAAAAPDALAGALDIGDPYFPGLGNGGYDVQHYDLELDVDMDSDEFAALARIDARATQELASFSFDLYGLEVESVLVDGQPARFERPAPPVTTGEKTPGAKPPKPSELVVFPAAHVASGAVFTTEIRYGGEPDVRPDPSVPFDGVGWMRRESGVYVVSECTGASSWFPCNDHPRDKASYSFRITVATPYTAAANGILREVVEDGEHRTFVFEAADPMASYLATLNIAEFGLIEATGPRGIPVRIYHPLDATEEELSGFRRQPEVLEFLEQKFGPYPFEAAGGVLSYENIGGALECQTLPVYGRGCGLEVIVHELAHQWFGDNVSPDLWRDMWLNEGFASYAGWLWDEHVGGAEGYMATVKGAYQELRKRKTGSPFDPGVQRVFSGRVYTRGAMVLHGLRSEVGDETFFEILQGWGETNHDGNGSTAGFVAHAGKVAGRDLAPFFDAWLYSEVTPEVEALGPVEPEPERSRSSGSGG
jgi:aminopeptidase N